MSPAVVLGIALLVLYWAWIGVFFARVRPWVMERVGRRLRVKVAESAELLDAGTYDVEGDDRPLGKSAAVVTADFVVLLLGTVGAAALLFVPAFVIAERGLLLPLEAAITGRGATLRVVDAGGMAAGTGKARFVVAAESTGDAALAGCRVGVDGYTARNGYLHGTSATFDLARGAPRTVELELEAMRPLPGEHRFRLELECANERFAVAEATLAVR